MQLSAVVIGAGLAGEGHTVALQYAGVKVQAICSRTPVVVSELAGRLGVGQASTDWRRTLETALAREFVADIRGESHTSYPTFRHGWINQEIVEVARSGSGWRRIPHGLPTDTGPG